MQSRRRCASAVVGGGGSRRSAIDERRPRTHTTIVFTTSTRVYSEASRERATVSARVLARVLGGRRTRARARARTRTPPLRLRCCDRCWRCGGGGDDDGGDAVRRATSQHRSGDNARRRKRGVVRRRSSHLIDASCRICCDCRLSFFPSVASLTLAAAAAAIAAIAASTSSRSSRSDNNELAGRARVSEGTKRRHPRARRSASERRRG